MGKDATDLGIISTFAVLKKDYPYLDLFVIPPDSYWGLQCCDALSQHALSLGNSLNKSPLYYIHTLESMQTAVNMLTDGVCHKQLVPPLPQVAYT